MACDLNLFGGATALLDHLQSTLHEQSLEASIALAGTATTALWLARSGTGRRIVAPPELPRILATLSIQHLHWPEDIVQRLRRFGVLNVGDLLRLPRAGLARRIGHRYLKELDEALGRQPEIRSWFQMPESYVDRVVLDFEIETTALLERLLQPRLKRLDLFLRARNLAAREIIVELLHREQTATPLRIGLTSPTTDVEHVTKLLHEHLSALHLPSPVREVCIRVPQLCDAAPHTDEFALSPVTRSDGRSTRDAAARLLEHLRAKLGSGAIRTLAAPFQGKADRCSRDLASQSTAHRGGREFHWAPIRATHFNRWRLCKYLRLE